MKTRSRPSWCSSEILRQLPVPVRAWGHWLRSGPQRRSGGSFGGSFLFRAGSRAARPFYTGMQRLRTVRSPRLPFAVTIDVFDFDAYHHTLSLALEGSSEASLIDLVFRPGDVFVDAGANYGLFSMLAARAGGASSRVVAFEPQPLVFEALRRSFAANGFSNAAAHRIALGEGEGTGTFHVPESGSGVASFFSRHASQSSRAVPVAVAIDSLDRVLATESGGPVSLLKVDCEGAEPEVFTGARGTLERDRPFVWFEANPEAQRAAGRSTDVLFQILEMAGYRTFLSIDRLAEGVREEARHPETQTNVLAIHADGLPAFERRLAEKAR